MEPMKECSSPALREHDVGFQALFTKYPLHSDPHPLSLLRTHKQIPYLKLLPFLSQFIQQNKHTCQRQ